RRVYPQSGAPRTARALELKVDNHRQRSIRLWARTAILNVALPGGSRALARSPTTQPGFGRSSRALRPSRDRHRADVPEVGRHAKAEPGAINGSETLTE